MRYIYCPRCGQKLGQREAGDDGMVPYCDNCSQYWFDAFSSAAIVLVVNELGEIALSRQSYISDRYWTFTAGFMKPGETAEETAVREVYEELGLRVEKLDYGGTYWFAMREQLMHAFIGHVKKRDFTLSVEVDEARWVTPEEAPSMLFPDVPGNALYPLLRKLKEQRG